ncbi:MAG: Xaa-Pro aminopeptidase [Planctomycetes bacterium]|nr:Xaa-Pro aminopeptidase [Planctomycetota bacterium]
MSIYQEHRAAYLKRLAELGAAAVIPTASEKTRNHDCTYRFRPHSDFWYLTGFAEPGSVLVLLPQGTGDEDSPRSVLFLRERDRLKEIWNGRRLGLERAPEALGVDEARPIEDLWDDLPQLLKGYASIVYRTGEEEDRDRRMLEVTNRLRSMARGGVVGPAALVDPAPSLHELRLFKTPGELDIMRRAAAITAEAHTSAMAATSPGRNESEIEALIEYTFRLRRSTGPAYTSIVAGGANACILHYVENDMPLVDGDLLLVDAGAEVEYYASDVTRTWPVNGTFSAEQRAVYQVVLDAQLAAIDHCRPGNTFLGVHEAALKKLVEGLVGLGLLEGDVDALIEDHAYDRFYMHKTGHWLGLDVHDQGAYAEDGSSRKLQPGMVTTVEPGIYIAEDDETVEARWRGIGVRIEDDVLITKDGCENLTAAIPKTIEEVEAACAQGELTRVG